MQQPYLLLIFEEKKINNTGMMIRGDDDTRKTRETLLRFEAAQRLLWAFVVGWL